MRRLLTLFLLLPLSASAQTMVVQDSFTDPAGVNLSAHIGDHGARYTPSVYTGDLVISSENRARPNSAGANAFYLLGQPATTNECDIEFDLYVKSTVNGDFYSVGGRMTDGENGIRAEYDSGNTAWFLFNTVAGSNTIIGTPISYPLTNNTLYHGKLAIRDAGKTLYFGVPGSVASIITTADNSLTGACIAGLGATVATPSDSTGFQFDNLTVSDISTTAVSIATTDDAVAVVAAGAAGTTYTFTCASPGCTHRITDSIVPRSGDTFITNGGAILSGAILLPSTVGGGGWSTSGDDWSYGVTARSSDHSHTGTSTDCDSGVLRCKYPEDLLIDNVVKRQVASTGTVVPGTWFYNYATNTVYIGDDPTGHVVELSVAEHAFSSSAVNVTIRGLIIEKFATLTQVGAVEAGGAGWDVYHNEIRFNHGRGVSGNTRGHIHGNLIHDNYQMGVGVINTASLAATVDDLLVDDNQITYNRSAVVGIQIAWEAGGTKFSFTNRLVLRRNHVHHNDGIGLWTDISNRHCQTYSNRVDDNTWAGVMHEISFDCVIHDNTIRRNGLSHPDVALPSKQCYVADAGIFIAASSNVELYRNYVEGNADGICFIQQDRSGNESFFGEADGAYRVRGANVHDNWISGSVGSIGLSADFLASEIADLTGTYAGADDPVEVRQPAGTGSNNRFRCNHYGLGAGSGATGWWEWTANKTFTTWQALGHDTNSGTACLADGLRGIAPGTDDGTYAAAAGYLAWPERPGGNLLFGVSR